MRGNRASRGAAWAMGAGLLLTFLYLVTIATTHYITNDAISSSLGAWRIATTAHPWLDGLDLHALTHRHDLWTGAVGSHTVIYRSPGSIAAAVPAYWIAGLVGVNSFSFVPGSVTAALLTAGAMVLLMLSLRIAGRRTAAIATLALGLTTPVWSVSANALWTHPVTLLGIGGMAWASSRERWWLVGVFGGVALWGRVHVALVVAVVGLTVAVAQRRPSVAVKVAVPSGLMLALAALWTHWMYGNWSIAGGYQVSTYAGRIAPGSAGNTVWRQLVNQSGLWIAPDRGILVWTPVLLLLLPALVRSWRTLPVWSRALLGGGLLYTLVQGQLNGFSGGSGFYGYRLTLELLACAFPALALSLPRTGVWARRLVGPVLGLQFAAISVGASGDGGMLRESTLWTDNSFWYAVRALPALGVWAVLMIAVGWWAGAVVRRRWAPPWGQPSEAPSAG